jgi:hypothetical protein
MTIQMYSDKFENIPKASEDDMGDAIMDEFMMFLALKGTFY